METYILRLPRKAALRLSSILLVVALLYSCQAQPVVDSQKASLIKVHKIDSDTLFLTDRISDFIKFDGGFLFAEQNKSNVLITDNSLQPYRRIGNKGQGPEEFDLLGSMEIVENGFLVHDRLHSRVVFSSLSGQFLKVLKHNILSFDILNLNVLGDTLLVFSIPDEQTPITTINLKTENIQQYEHNVSSFKNTNQSIRGNMAYLKNWDGYIFYFPPTELTVEVLDSNFKMISKVDLTGLDFLQTSLKRANEMYATSNNKTLDYYSDVYQSGSDFYLSFYSDFYDQSSLSYKRDLNTLVKLSFDSDKKELLINQVIELDGPGYYKQIVVDDKSIYAFDLREFSVNEFYQ